MGALSDFFGAIKDPQFRSDVGGGVMDSLNRGVIGQTLGAPIDMANVLTNLAKAAYGTAGHATGLLSADQMPDLEDKPVGGSEWLGQKMQDMGIVSDRRNPLAEGLAGAALAPLGGTALAARAPQIASGLLKMGENAAIPSTMNPQTGAIVWHGSPHKFDAFDASKIGAGEGAQAYGHGLYLADAPEVAGQYAANVKDMGAVQRINTELSTLSDAMGKDAIPGAYRKYRTDSGAQAAKRYDELMVARDSVRNAPGSLYKVDLPDEHIAKMLDWDKPLSEQHPDVQAAVNNIKDGLPLSSEGWNPKPWIEADPLASTFHNTMHREGLLTQDALSDALQKAGVPGIRYLDGGSRGAGAGTSNYVIFPGNENMLQILDRNGQSLPGQ